MTFFTSIISIGIYTVGLIQWIWSRVRSRNPCLEVIFVLFSLEKEFRLISMEDYKNRDAYFLVQINLITELLKYWRNFRKNKE